MTIHLAAAQLQSADVPFPFVSLSFSSLPFNLKKSAPERDDFLRPSPEDQNACINKFGTFNYDAKYSGKSAEPASSIQQDSELSRNVFSVNDSRTLVGSGLDAYKKGKIALENWRHFGLDWAFVDPKTPIQSGLKFCVCEKEFFPWLMMPLQVIYVNNDRNSNSAVASFSFGSGTLKGHLLAGEESFSITLDENNQVWYEILSFSRSAHFLSLIGYRYALLRQKSFAYQSSMAVRKHLSCK